jgi:hypothetical protein
VNCNLPLTAGPGQGAMLNQHQEQGWGKEPNSAGAGQGTKAESRGGLTSQPPRTGA